MSLKRLIEICDEKYKNELTDYYIVSSDRMDMIIRNFEEQKNRIIDLTETIERQQEQLSKNQESMCQVEDSHVQILENDYWRLNGLVSSCIRMYKESFLDEHLLPEDELYTQLLEIGAFLSVFGKVKSCFPNSEPRTASQS